MSAHRLTLNNFIRNGHRIAFLHHPPVQSSQNETHEEEHPIGRLADTVVPLVNLVVHRPDPTQFNSNFLVPPPWPTHDFSEGDAKLKHRVSEIYGNGVTFVNRPKKSTAEVSVQTDVSGEVCHTSLERVDKMKWELENKIGEGFMKEERYEEAVVRFEAAAERGNMEAMNNLADCLFNEYGTKENKREAWRLWKQAAALGHTKAMYSLAVCYLRGEGTVANNDEAMKWMWMAANSGDSDAAFYLIVRVMRDGKPERGRRLVRTALRDGEYAAELKSWVEDECLPDECLRVLKEELGLSV